MARKFEMGWEAGQHRWKKMLHGVMYRVKCRDLKTASGQPLPEACWNKKDSGEAANRWWLDKVAELAAARRAGHPHAEVIETLTERIEIAQQEGLDDEVAELENTRRQVEEAAGDADGPDPLPLPPHIREWMAEMERAGVRFPKGMEPALLWHLSPSEAVWAERQRRQAHQVEDRSLGHWCERWYASKQEEVAKGNLQATGIAQMKAAKLFLLEELDAKLTIDALSADASQWEKWPRFCTSQVVNKVWSSGYAKALYKRGRGIVQWILRCNRLMLPATFDKKVNLEAAVDEDALWGPDDGIVVYSNEQVRRLLGAARGQMRLHILLGLNCGFHAVDVCKMKVKEINPAGTAIRRQRTKTKRQGLEPVTWPLWPATQALLRQQPGVNGYALAAPRGDHWHAYNLSCYFLRLVKKAGVGGSFKALRKTAATRLGNHPVYGKWAPHFLGHAPASVADRHYIQKNQAVFAEAVEWLGRDLGLYEQEQG
jgi:integrase